jgi:hypothetical protein
MPLQATSGAASYDAFGGGVAAVPNYIEDVFSTYLYTGNDSTQTITNGIDLSTKGGLVWIKKRSAAGNNFLFDTARGVGRELYSNTTDAQNGPYSDTLTSFNTTGFSLGASADINGYGNPTYASWTFRKQPKFFDVLTYTGDGTSNRAISHNLGSTPGCIIVKQTNAVNSWAVLHRGDGSTSYSLTLNSTGAGLTPPNASAWGNGSSYVAPTSTQFTVGTSAATNASGGTYVAYLFAHNAGGFGLSGTDNVISCGSYTLDASGNADINLGYEPQWVLLKKTNGAAGWGMMDTMRGFSLGGDEGLLANSSNAAFTYGANVAYPTATGFSLRGWGASGSQEIYIAIRRGPMKVPTDATKVFSNNATTGSTGTAITTNFPVDLYVWQNRDGTYSNVWQDRLRGIPNTDTTGVTLTSQSTLAEQSGGYNGAYQPWNTGLRINSGASGANSIYWNFRRAPSFFDEVCYTGDGTADSRTFTHNLGVTPQLVIVKRRSSTSDWVVTFNTDHAVLLNSTNADTGYSNATGNYANGILIGTNATTLTQYSGASGNSACNASGSTYVAYLFATCAGVSKVGSYTGTGALQTVNCGFAAGARFVLIKRTDSTGDWYVYDSARGITSGNDPYLFLNSTAAEVTGTNYVDTDTTGFKVTAAAPAGLNASGGTYIFLAIA